MNPTDKKLEFKKKYGWIKYVSFAILLATIIFFVCNLSLFFTKIEKVTYHLKDGDCTEVYVNGKLNSTKCYVVDTTVTGTVNISEVINGFSDTR